jgi:NADH dehydrogenase FAD-containing subunit
VIIGGGSGGFHTVESLREHGFKGPITILSAENHAPVGTTYRLEHFIHSHTYSSSQIDRTKLSKALVTDPSKLEWRSAADLKIKCESQFTQQYKYSLSCRLYRYGVSLRTGVEATSVDFKGKTVTIDGKETIKYGTVCAFLMDFDIFIMTNLPVAGPRTRLSS